MIIGGTGFVLAYRMLEIAPADECDLLAIEEYAYYGYAHAVNSALGWLTLAVWSGFTAVLVATWERARIWMICAGICAGVMIVTGAIALLVNAVGCTGS